MITKAGGSAAAGRCPVAVKKPAAVPGGVGGRGSPFPADGEEEPRQPLPGMPYWGGHVATSTERWARRAPVPVRFPPAAAAVAVPSLLINVLLTLSAAASHFPRGRGAPGAGGRKGRAGKRFRGAAAAAAERLRWRGAVWERGGAGSRAAREPRDGTAGPAGGGGGLSPVRRSGRARGSRHGGGLGGAALPVRAAGRCRAAKDEPPAAAEPLLRRVHLHQRHRVPGAQGDLRRLLHLHAGSVPAQPVQAGADHHPAERRGGQEAAAVLLHGRAGSQEEGAAEVPDGRELPADGSYCGEVHRGFVQVLGDRRFHGERCPGW